MMKVKCTVVMEFSKKKYVEELKEANETIKTNKHFNVKDTNIQIFE